MLQVNCVDLLCVPFAIYLGGAAERGENASPCAMPESGYASGSAMDWSAQVRECAVEPTTVAEVLCSR